MSTEILATDRLYIPAQVEEMSQIYGLLARFGEATEPWIQDGMVFPAFMTAVVEIATNIMRHAYPPGVQAGAMEVTLTLTAGRLEARFCDQGVPFKRGDDDAAGAHSSTDAEQAGASPNPLSETLPAGLELDEEAMDLPEGGFGLFVARQALDVLDYRRTPQGDNCWLLVKEF